MTKEIELTGANLYDMNKQLVEHYESKMSKKTLEKIINKIVIPYFEESLQNHKYFMLLCHDARDYTVFNILESDDNSKNIIATELKDCFTARGDIYSIELTQQEDALEIWIKSFSDSKMYCYYLFPYDFGVIEIDKTGGHSYE